MVKNRAHKDDNLILESTIRIIIVAQDQDYSVDFVPY